MAGENSSNIVYHNIVAEIATHRHVYAACQMVWRPYANTFQSQEKGTHWKLNIHMVLLKDFKKNKFISK